MPEEVYMMIEERTKEKNEERKMKDDMRKQAEEEILKELRMAEDFFKRNEFEQTQKGYHFYEDRDDDLEERDTTPPTVSGAEDHQEEHKDKEHNEESNDASSPQKERTWEDVLEQ